MKVKRLIKYLQSLKPELQDKDIYVVAKNGMFLDPHIKFQLKEVSLAKTKENVKCLFFENK